MASCRASAICIASGASCHKRVLPSMSVNRNVNVPLGSGGVEASARVIEGIGLCAIRHGAITREWTKPPTNAAPGKRITGWHG